jgi:hypothetical protein
LLVITHPKPTRGLDALSAVVATLGVVATMSRAMNAATTASMSIGLVNAERRSAMSRPKRCKWRTMVRPLC